MSVKYSVESPADEERNMKVYKADKLIQRARYELTITEQRFVLYVMSKIKPEDTPECEYVINLRDFQFVCGTEDHDSYTHIKQWLKHLADKSWWLLTGNEEVLVRWFNKIKITKDSGIVTVRFDEDMFPFAFKLAEQMRSTGSTYTSYMYRYILPMRSTYSVRLYELIKSYQKNNTKWEFDIDELKHLLDCERYVRYPDFRRFILNTATEEINKYTDTNVEYHTIQKGRKVIGIVFEFKEKSMKELIKAHHAELTELDGNIHYWDNKKED